MKKLIMGLIVVSTLTQADYVMEYQMEEDTQKFMYKNSSTAKLINNSEGDRSSIYKIGKKTYIVTNNGRDKKIVDMDEMKAMANSFGFDPSQHMHEEEMPPAPKIRKTGKRVKVAGVNGEVWSVSVYEDGLKHTSEMVVTKDKRVVKSVRSMSSIFTSMSGGMDAGSGLEIKKGYVIIQADGMRLKSFKDKKVNANEYKLPNDASKQDMAIGAGVSDELVKDCYTKVCCGEVASESEVLSEAIVSSYKGYKLVGSGVCDAMGLASALGIKSIEGALYTKGSDNVQVTLNLDDPDEGTLKKTKQNLDNGYKIVVSDIKNYKSYSKGSVNYYYGVLMPMNQETLDIIVSNKVTVTLSRKVVNKRKELDLKTFANVIDISALQEASKNAPQKSNEVDIDADKAMNMLKSFF